MKRILLFTFAIGFALSVSAQSSKYLQINGNVASAKFNSEKIDAPSSNPVMMKSIEKKNVNSSDLKFFTITIDSLGQAGNALGLYNGGRTALWLDPNLNSIMFTHRNLSPSGTIDYDFSVDGGNTWVDNTIAYNTTGNGARYPQGLIYNPTGNTIPDSAYAVTFSALRDGSNPGGGGDWGGYAMGVHNLTNTALAPVEKSLAAHGAYKQQIPEAMHVNPVTGKVWVLDPALTGALNNAYTDSIIFNEGVFNAGTKDVDYTQSLFYAPVSVMVGGNNATVSNTRIAFAPDGNTGWISLISHNDWSVMPDSAFYPIFYKTTNGGTTWTGPMNVDLASIPAIRNFITDSLLEILLGYPPVPETRDSLMYGTAFDADMVVDGNGNPYLAVDVSLFTGTAGGGTGWSVATRPGLIGMFLIFSPDGGSTWDAQFLSYVETFRGTFPGASPISEDNRPQLSTTWDGSKIFATWLDTDTMVFGSADGNFYPDIFFRGYDPATGYMTSVQNVTQGSNADGAAFMGTASYYVFDNGGSYEIPLAYQILDVSDNALPVQFMYIKGFTVNDADFVGVKEVAENIDFVSQNYPNPFSNSTNIVISLNKSSDVAVTVTNLLGQQVSAMSYGTMGIGNHNVAIDGSKLTSGIYFYTVKAGEYAVTHKMIVE